MGAAEAELLLGAHRANGWVENLDEDVYHADRTAVNSSSLRKILKSPASFRNSFFGHEERTETKALKLGKLIHKAILEPGAFMGSYYVMPDFKTHPSSNAYKASKAAWMNDLPMGATIVTEAERDQIQGIANAVLTHPDAKAMLTGGKSEITGYYRDPETGINCRIRPDFLHFDLRALVDLKSTRDCTREAFQRALWTYNYHFQLAMYCEGIKAITGFDVKFPAIIAVEKEPPFEVAVYVVDQGSMDLGLSQYRKALLILSECLKTGIWTRYQTGMQDIAVPHYAFERD